MNIFPIIIIVSIFCNPCKPNLREKKEELAREVKNLETTRVGDSQETFGDVW